LARRSFRRRSRTPWGWLLVVALAAAAGAYLGHSIGRAISERTAPVPEPVTLVDPRHELVTATTPGWEYQRSLQADLDGDNTLETIEILARVLRSPSRPGEYQWDDGQPWQVYVKDGDHITHIYARYVQLGGLEVLVTDEPQPRLVIAETQGAGYALYAVEYGGPGKAKATELAAVPVRDRAH
jgi:hypothetical protein